MSLSNVMQRADFLHKKMGGSLNSDARFIKDMSKEIELCHFILASILRDLPDDKNWLDSDIEKEAREIINS